MTYANANDVFEDGGSVRYDAANNTLTLTDATIASQLRDDFNYWLITNDKTNICAGGDLKIVLSGNNILSSDPDTDIGIEVLGSLTIGGTGSLTYCCTCEYGKGIVAYGTLSLEDRITLRISTAVGEPFSADFIALRGSTDFVIADTLEIILPGNPLIEDGTLYDMDNEASSYPWATYGFPTSVVIGPEGTPVLPYAVTIADDIQYGTVTTDRDRGNAGDTVTLTAVPDYSTFVSWNVTDENGDPITVTNNTFTLPNGDVTVSAVFDPQYFTVTTATMAHGSISADTQQARPGDTINLTASPEEGYQLMFWNPSGHIGGTNWTIKPDDNSGVFYAAEGADSFVMPAANVTVTARFEAITYQILNFPT